MPVQHPTIEILLAITLSFSILLILFVAVGAAVASLLSEEQTKVEPPLELELQPSDRTEL